MARLVDAAVCVTQSLAEYARECYGIERCIVAPNGGDPASYRNGGGTFLADLKDRFTVLWAGRADGPWHGLEQILAAARVCEEAAPDVLFVLILAGAPHAMPHRRNVLVLRETDRPTAVRYLADADCAAVIYRRCDWRRPEGSPLKV